MTSIGVYCHDELLLESAQACADALGVPLQETVNTEYSLVFAAGRVALKSEAKPGFGDIQVDFCAGGAAHRRRYGGGNGQMIAKAAGVSGRYRPHVFDATAGLGGDAFVLACLGCRVTLMERSPVALALLRDGLKRARHTAETEDPELLLVLNNMVLIAGNSIEYLAAVQGKIADVVYLDPMFPPRQKSAAVKKEMAAFHQVIGLDQDDDNLLEVALAAAEYRVVVKRPRLAPPLLGPTPSTQHMGKSSRFDIYAIKRFN